MRALARYILRGRIQAAGITGLFGALGWIIPFFFLISCAAVGLVALRQDKRTTIQVLAGATLFCGVVAVIRFGNPILALMNLMAIWIPVWLSAQILRATRSQTVVLIVVMSMSLLLAIGMRYFTGGVETFWEQNLTRYSSKVDLVTNAEKQAEVIKTLSVVMNGFVALSFVLMVMTSVLLARWWQSLIYNPGGFGKEFRRIQFPAILTVPVLISAALIEFMNLSIPPYGLLLDFLLIGTTILMFHGLSVVHYFVKERQLANAWLAGLYFFLMAASVYVFSLLAMLAIADSFSDFRKLRSKVT